MENNHRDIKPQLEFDTLIREKTTTTQLDVATQLARPCFSFDILYVRALKGEKVEKTRVNLNLHYRDIA